MKRTDGPFPLWEIIPGALYQRQRTHPIAADVKEEGLEFYGITWVAAMAPTFVDPDFQALANDAAITYTHFPIPDSKLKEKDAAFLLNLAKDMAKEIAEGGAVMTACNGGRNRSGLLAALIIREAYGLPGKAAMDIVRTHRPNALANPYFEEFLESLP